MFKNARDVLEAWIQGVNKGETQTLVDLYDNDSVLIPTFSSRILNTKDKKREYFEKLGTKKDLAVSLHEKTFIEQDLKNGTFVLNGLYKWSFSIDGEMLDFEARFTYVVNLTKKNPIQHHHSSQIPRSL